MAKRGVPRNVVASILLGTSVAVPLLRMRRNHETAGPKRSWRSGINSHVRFSHDSLDNLGYDWERVANPSIQPRYPLKIYLPRTTRDVVEVVNEVKELGQVLKIRAKGHSSNDLVLADRGAVLLTEKLDTIIDLNEADRTLRVQAGVILADIDEYLAPRGYGLPIIGNHNHIPAGGFASVGGISAAAHRHGLFVDNVEEVEYVDWDGAIVTCSRTHRRDDFYRVLGSLGRHGVITTLKLRIIPVAKWDTILENDRSLYAKLPQFLIAADACLRHPDEIQYPRILWLDLPLPGGRSLTFGSISRYRTTQQSRGKTLRNGLAYGYLHRLGYLSGHVPAALAQALKVAGTLGLFMSPKYASIKNVEVFLDKIINYSIGDPTRWFIIWAPLEAYAPLFRQIYALIRDYRQRHGCFTFISADLRPFRSEYLGRGDDQKLFVDLVFEVGLNLDRLTNVLLDDLVSQIDDLCIRHGAYRYMHSKTVKDPDRLRHIDPSSYYARGVGAAPAAGE